jgi:hypothetical protein
MSKRLDKNMKKFKKRFKPVSLRIKKIRWNRPRALLAIAIIAIGGGYFVYKSFAFSYYPLHNDETFQMSHINATRNAHGLADYSISPCLTRAARANALWEAQNQRGREMPVSLVNSYCGTAWTAFGANDGPVSPMGWCKWNAKDNCDSDLYNAFLASAPHKANILDRTFHFMGAGAYRDSKGTLWVSIGFGAGSVFPGDNTNVHATITAVSPAAGSNVKGGQQITLQVSYNAIGQRRLENAHLNGFVPENTTFVSMWDGHSNPLLTSSGTASNDTPYDYTQGQQHTYWLFNYIPGNGATYDHDSFNYTVKVKSGLANGSKICPFATVRGGNYNDLPYQPSWDDWMSCYTVQN